MTDASERRDDEPDIDDTTFTCWCGAKGTYDELFDDAYLDAHCGGSGVLYCYCGGGQCVCHHHGETECPGCPDCIEDDEDCDYGDDGRYDDGAFE